MTARRNKICLFHAYFSQRIWINHGFEDSQPLRILAILSDGEAISSAQHLQIKVLDKIMISQHKISPSLCDIEHLIDSH